LDDAEDELSPLTTTAAPFEDGGGAVSFDIPEEELV